MSLVRHDSELSARQIGDLLADQAFAWLHEQPAVYQQLKAMQSNADLRSIPEGSPFYELVESMRLPDWADEDQLQIATRFFQRHINEVLAVLGLYSLPYCYAGANGVRVLYHSKKIRENPETRLLDTARFVLSLFEENSFSPDKKAFVALLNVRLMHAGGRHYTRKHITDEEPVNQEDMLGTMLAFSLLVIRGLRQMKVEVSDKEAEACLHFWMVAGSLLGIEEQRLPKTIRHASQMERGIRKREFRYSPEAAELTRVLLIYLDAQELPIPGVRPVDLLNFFLGQEVAACLGLPKTPAAKLQLLEAGNYFRNSWKSFSENNFSKAVDQLEKLKKARLTAE